MILSNRPHHHPSTTILHRRGDRCGSAKNIVGAFWQPARVVGTNAKFFHRTVPPPLHTYIHQRSGGGGNKSHLIVAIFEKGETTPASARSSTAACGSAKNVVEQDESERDARKAPELQYTIGLRRRGPSIMLGRRTRACRARRRSVRWDAAAHDRTGAGEAGGGSSPVTTHPHQSIQGKGAGR